MTTIFLSYSSKDKAFVKLLADRLAREGVGVWIDEVELDIGDSLVGRISEGIKDSDYIAAFISQNSVESNWVQKELHMAMTREIIGRRVIVLPILIGSCEIPFFLIDKLYADFTKEENFDDEFAKIVRSIKKPIKSKQEQKKLKSNSEQVGSLDIGSVIHDRGDDFFGYKAARERKKYWVFLVFGGTLIPSVVAILHFITKTVSGAFYLLSFWGSLIVISGFLFGIAGNWYKKAFDKDRKLLFQVEKIGKGFVIPFGQMWQKLYKIGVSSNSYRWGLIADALAIIIFILAMIVLIIMWPVVA